ncbi:MAG: hypothetical protein ACK5OX_13820 [Desertimonas sp.]
MTELWARIEPLLGLVQRPARYIGCEDGAVTPRHGAGSEPWPLARPDTFEIGLPDQGFQFLDENLNELGDIVAEHADAPWTTHDGQRDEVMPLDDDVRLASLGAAPVPIATVGT